MRQAIAISRTSGRGFTRRNASDYSLINAAGERVWCKFHFKTQQGIATLTDDEAGRIIGTDRESHQRDLFDAILPRSRRIFQQGVHA